MFYEVTEMIDTAWGYDEVVLAQFDTFAEAEQYIEDNFDEDVEDLYIADAYGEVVWG